MSPTTVAAVQDLRNDFIIKPTVGAAIIADFGATAGIDSLFAADGTLNTLPAGWYSCGSTDTGGLQFNRALTVQDTMTWQSTLPARSDVTADKRTVQVKFAEALKRPVQALEIGLTVAATPTIGAVFKVDTDSTGNQPLRRLLCVGYDPALDVTLAREFFKVKVSNYGNQVWDRAAPAMVDVTFDTYIDPVWGTSDRRFVGGAGWVAMLPPPPWAASTAYPLNSKVTLQGTTLQATTAGTSAATAPTPPAVVGGTVTDGTVVWTRTA